MCVYLAPRWRRRSTVTLLLALAFLFTTDARVLHSQRQVIDSGSAVSEPEVGVVTTNSAQSAMTRAWNSSSNDGSQEKTITFDSLVERTTAPMERTTEQSASSSSSTTRTPQTSNSSSDEYSKEGVDSQDDDRPFDDSSFNASADSSDSKSTNEENAGKADMNNKATTTAPTPAPTSAPMPAPTTAKPTRAPRPAPTTAKPTHAPPPHPMKLDTKSSSAGLASGSGEQGVTGQLYEESSSSTNSAEALENKTKAAASSTSSTTFDNTLVVVIVGVVGAIGALLMFVSRRVLKESEDFEDSKLF